MRVVLDANVFISFLLTKGETISAILTKWEKERFVLLVSRETFEEIKSVAERLVGKGLITPLEKEIVLFRLWEEAEIVEVTSKIRVSPDKKDNRYLALARDGKADYLVTGDRKHLLPLKGFHKTKIVSPAEFIEQFDLLDEEEARRRASCL